MTRRTAGFVVPRVVALGAALAGCHRGAHESEKSHERATRTEVASTNDERRAIERAARYFRTVPSTNPEAGILTQMLARKFPHELGFTPEPFPPLEALGPHALVVSRFSEPDRPMTLDMLEGDENPINRVTAAALYCDRIPLQPGFIDAIRAMNATGGLYLTHGVMATQWATENGCLAPSDIPYDVTDLQVRGLQVIESAEITRNTDIRVEAMAFLYYLGHAELVPDSLVRELLSTQNDDGGFGGLGPGSPSNHHTTALALWVLLEHEYPGRRASWLPSRRSTTPR